MFEDLPPGASLSGILPNQMVTAVAANRMGNHAVDLTVRASRA